MDRGCFVMYGIHTTMLVALRILPWIAGPGLAQRGASAKQHKSAYVVLDNACIHLNMQCIYSMTRGLMQCGASARQRTCKQQCFLGNDAVEHTAGPMLANLYIRLSSPRV